MSRGVIDWWQVIVDLERSGYTLSSVAAGAGVASSTLKGWKNLGHEPRHSDGNRLLSLWSAGTQRPVDEAPTMRPILSAASLR